MNRQQLREVLRTAVLDDAAEPYLWSNTILDTFIEEAYQEASIRSLMVRNTISIPLVQGQSEYPMPDTLLKIERFRLAGIQKLVLQTTTAELDESGKWEIRSGIPEFFTFTPTAYGGDGVLTVYPIPSSDITASAATRELPDPITSDTDSLALPPHLHMHLLDWCAFRAFSMRDSEANDEARAAKHAVAFERNFGERHSADAMRERNDRKKHRTKMNVDYWN